MIWAGAIKTCSGSDTTVLIRIAGRSLASRMKDSEQLCKPITGRVDRQREKDVSMIDTRDNRPTDALAVCQAAAILLLNAASSASLHPHPAAGDPAGDAVNVSTQSFVTDGDCERINSVAGHGYSHRAKCRPVSVTR